MSAEDETISKCIGLLGRLFGHKFVKYAGDYVYSGHYCYRCGMPKGGWNYGATRNKACGPYEAPEQFKGDR